MGISYLIGPHNLHISTIMSSKVSPAWTWESLPSFQELSAAIRNPKDMPELEKAFLDMKDRLTKMQVPADMDATVAVMKDNMDKLLELLNVACDRIKESNNKLMQVTLSMFGDITKELSQKIKEASKENFTQPQIKSALKMFSDNLDWINNLLEDFMKENLAVNGTAPASDKMKPKSATSRLSFKSRK